MRRRGGYYYSSYRESAVKKLLLRAYKPILVFTISFLLVHSCFFRSYQVQNEALAPDILPGDVLLVQLVGNSIEPEDPVLVYPPYARQHTPVSLVLGGIRAVRSRFFDAAAVPSYRYTPVIRYVAPPGWDPAPLPPDTTYVPVPDTFLLGESQLGHFVPDDDVAVYASGGNGFLDSRHYGPIARERVRGTVVLRIWPLQRWGRPRRVHSGN